MPHSSRVILSALCIVVVLSLVAGLASAGAGGIDPTFGSTGYTVTPDNLTSWPYLALDSSNRLLVAESATVSGAPDDIALYRYTADGILDTTFNSTGKATLLDFLGSSQDNACGVAVQSTGKPIVAGGAGSGAVGVARYTTGGALDTSFDSDGKLTRSYSSSEWSGLALDSSDNIYVAGRYSTGSTSYASVVVEFSASGSYVRDFSASLATSPGYFEKFQTVAIQPDGKVLAGGYAAIDNGVNPMSLARFNTDGSLDTGFSGDGKFTLSIGRTPANNDVYGIAVQSDNKIVVSGDCVTTGGVNAMYVMRLNSNGTLDTTGFGGGIGYVIVELPGGYASNVVVQDDGKLVVFAQATRTTADYVVVRLNSDGTLDDTFGTGGLQYVDFDGATEDIGQGALQGEKMVVAGRTHTSSSNGLGLVRLLAADQNMAYSNSTTAQNSADMFPGVSDWVIRVSIGTIGSLSPLSATSFTFNTNGTTSTADVASARVYYTGDSTTFDTSTPFGTAVANPNGSFTITGDQVLAAGANVFWLEYSVPESATVGHYVDAECTSLTVGGSAHTPSVTAPTGSRKLVTPFYPTITATYYEPGDPITNVTFDTINNTTELSPNGYGDYTSQVAHITQGESKPLSVTILRGDTSTAYPTTAWVDWNHDYDFDDSGEEFILNTSTKSNGPFTVQVVAPLDAYVGATRMRVATQYSGAPPNSGVISMGGEAEDYTVQIQTRAEAELGITKTDGLTQVVPGTSLSYTIVVTNSGDADATDATVTDSFPAALTGATWTCAASGGAACSAAGSGDINDTVDVPVGGSLTYTVNATVAPGATGGVTNTAIVTVPSGTIDPFTANNSATDVDTLTPQVDLGITKTDGQDSAVPGSKLTYTIVVTNAGPSNAMGATVTDSFPATLTGATWTCAATGGATCTASGSGNISQSVNVPAGGRLTYTVTATVSSGATGSVANTATVAAPAGATELVPANNSATDTDALTPQADLGISKTDGQATAVPGAGLSYTIVVTNAGPSNAPGATVTDDLPAVLTGVAWTCAASGGAICTASGSGDIDESVNLPSGGRLTYTVVATPTTDATGSVENSAAVVAPVGVTELIAGNNVVTDTDTLTPQADLGVLKSDGQASAVPGLPLTYTISISNSGPSDAPGTTAGDVFPAVLSGIAWTCTGHGGADCTPSGTGDVAETIDLPAGSAVTYTISADLAVDATGSLANTAYVTAAIGVTDPATGNNFSTDTDTLAPLTGLGISKTDGQDTTIPGLPVTYTLVVTNTGPSTAVGARVTDTFPAAVDGATWSCAASGGASCTASGTGDIADGVTLPGGSRITYTVNATVASGAMGTLLNTASVAPPDGGTDPLLADNESADTDALTPEFDLTLSMSESSDPVDAGSGTGNLLYVVEVANNGPSDAADVLVSDVLTVPTGVSIDSIVPSSGGYITGSWSIDALPAGDTAALTVTLTVGPEAPLGTDLIAAEAAIVTATGTLLATGDDWARESTSIARRVDLAVSKSADPAQVKPGGTVTYTLVYTNGGPALATGVFVTDLLPSTLLDPQVLHSGAAMTWTGSANYTWAVADLPPGEGGLVTITAQVDPNLTNTVQISNRTEISGAEEDSDRGNNDSTADVLVPIVELSLTKSMDDAPVGVGAVITYTLTVQNHSATAATDVVVRDILPAGVTLVGSEATNGSYAGGLWTLDAPLPGTNASNLVVTATVDAGTRGWFITNTAAIVAVDQFDWRADNDIDQAAFKVQEASLSITKTAPLSATPGANITYTVVVVNAGPDPAFGAVVSDALPAAVSAADWTCASAGGASCAGVGTGDVVDVANLPAGSSVTYYVTGTLSSAATGTVENSATVIVAGGLDPNTADNTAAVMTALTPQADLTISKTAVRDGDALLITYILTVDNAGPSDVSGATVSDPVPSEGIGDFTAWSCSGSGGASCGGPGSGSVSDSATVLPKGGRLVYTIQGTTLDANAGITNTASVTVPVTVRDPNGGNDAATNVNYGTRYTFLPLIQRGYIHAPDLIVEIVEATATRIKLKVTNQGNAPVTRDFWVDVYFGPAEVPTVNHPWATIAPAGLAWGVLTSEQPLGAGESIELVTGGAYYFSPPTSSPAPWPTGAATYAYVDSVDYRTDYGSVWESDESNNLAGPHILAATADGTVTSIASMGRPGSLPPRK